jgi:3-deoxy-D-manno-octulosonic-acid transferase
MLQHLCLLACQSDEHVRRFIALGARADVTRACGSLKFDVQLPEKHRQQVAAHNSAWQLDDRFVWCAGSTHPGEEEQILSAHQRLLEADPHALLILAPRHPVRCAEVASLLERLQLSYVRLTDAKQLAPEVQVLLVDTLGNLQTLYGVADIAFLGGSLVPAGGHNPIEAAACSVPALIGPEYFNFADVVAAFVAAEAIEIIADANQLADSLITASCNPEQRRRRGAAALKVVADNRGALAVLAEILGAEIRRISLPNDP